MMVYVLWYIEVCLILAPKDFVLPSAYSMLKLDILPSPSGGSHACNAFSEIIQEKQEKCFRPSLEVFAQFSGKDKQGFVLDFESDNFLNKLDEKSL